MIDEIISAWREAMASKNSTDTTVIPQVVCRYCNKSFRRESTLVAHLCESKRRWQQEKETGVQFGLRSYLRFYELSQGSSRLKSYEDFVSSPYYIAFVKFGRHLVDIRAVNPAAFIEWVLKENKKIDHWCHESVYVEYLMQYLKREAPQDALERALTEMQKHVDENTDQYANGFTDYFKVTNANRICQHISSGRVSPWVVFNCRTGVEFLESLTEEQLGIIIEWIDPTLWNKKFQDYAADAEWIKKVLMGAGL